jgi:two-component system sensor histidine kinase RegB
MSLTQLVEEAAEPYRGFSAELVLSVARGTDADGAEPVGERRPGVIYGLGNLIENAVDFARRRVELIARWSPSEVAITIVDDGPGISRDIMDALGDPFITTRQSRGAGPGSSDEPTGLGLGFFIAKTLLERSGAIVSFENRIRPAIGAEVKIVWPRAVFEGRPGIGHGADVPQAFSPRELSADRDG